MYRTATNQIFVHSLRRSTAFPAIGRPAFLNSAGFCTPPDGSQNISVSGTIPPPNSFRFDSSSSPQTTSGAAEEGSRSSGSRSRIHGYEEEQARVLHASLSHVNSLGWTEAAMMAGAREVGVSPSIIGSLPRKEAALVEYFMDDCLERFIDVIESDVELKNLVLGDRISKLVKIRLVMQAPYASKWAQALNIQALLMNIPSSFKQRAALVDEMWHAAGDDASDLDWYVKRTVLGGIYSTTEVYMLTDNSPDFHDTWAFLDARVRDAFDLKKTLPRDFHDTWAFLDARVRDAFDLKKTLPRDFHDTWAFLDARVRDAFDLKKTLPRDFHDTWAFLDARVRDAFDLKKTLQEAQNLAESVSTCIGNSLQVVMKGVFKA